MSNRNDTILAGAAGVILVATAALYFLLIKPLAPTENTPMGSLTRLPAGEAYPSTPRAEILGFASNWNRPEEHEEGWNYDIFDPVETVWDEQLREYQPKSYTPPVIPPFGIKLVRLGHPHYPIVLSGSSAGPKGEEDRILFLENIDTKSSFNARLKKPIAELGITPLSFRTEKTTAPDGAPVTRKVLRIKDNKLGRELEIDDVKPLEFTDQLDIVLVASSGSPDWTFHATGARFEFSGATYVVKGVDLQAGTVTVDKTFTPNPRKGPKTFTETLSIEVPVTETKTPAPATKPAPATPSPVTPSPKGPAHR